MPFHSHSRFAILVLLARGLLVGIPSPAKAQGPNLASRALAPLFQGEPGFRERAPEATGLESVNRLDELDAARNRTLLNGSGVAFGDYDGDGWVDVYLCGLNAPNALYRNREGWRFQEVTAEAGVACENVFCRGAVMSDVTGDGALDLLLGVLSNQWNSRGIRLVDSPLATQPEDDPQEDSSSPPPPGPNDADEGLISPEGFPVVEWPQVEQLAQQQTALLVDARHEWAFSNGHIPGAVNLPFSFSKTKAHQTFAKTYPKDRRLVLYCGDPACDRSKYLAIKLRDDFGFSRLFIYADGYQDYLKHAE